MIRGLSILERNNLNGAIIPDPSSQMTGAAPWRAGMFAHRLGFIPAAKAMLASPTERKEMQSAARRGNEI